jgi:hypothetical protein
MNDQVLREAWEFDVAGAYRLDDEERIGKQFAELEHVEQALAYERRNLTAMKAYLDRTAEELERLRPHWRPGMTKKDAIAAYVQASADGPDPLTSGQLLEAVRAAALGAGPDAVVRMAGGKPVASVSVRDGVVEISDSRQDYYAKLA